jgi:uncharacterized protein YyaL (SSP411 family)
VVPTNRLADERSPYLRQHAHNPVDWFPWGDEAFAAARGRDVPVFLSIGYSACHWCHVMAHESFEDAEVAKRLNDRFVAVKVDREERPDVDAVYMAATLAMNGHGGWPMSVFLTPDGRPFFAGTYFPPADRHGLPGFARLLDAIAEAWRDRRAEVERQADALARAAADQAAPTFPEPTPAAEGYRARLRGAVSELAARFDPARGGFGAAPKFPQPALVELCLRAGRLLGDDAASHMAEVTLRAMATGGLHDHLGGGFARYSTDESWTVPHFEKMLYDQAGLVRAYLHAWQATGRAEWLQVVDDTITYVLRDLRHDAGGLCSAEDADSEGEEGRFYLWTAEELDAVLGPEAPAAAAYYGLDAGPNFEGRNILRLEPSASLLRGPEVERRRQALLTARATRVRPGLDDKVLTEWNAMFCSALAEAAAAAGRDDWARAAEETGAFLLANLRDEHGRWLRSWQAGRAGTLAYAGDYAWLVDAFTRLAELTGKVVWLDEAATVAGQLLELFRPDDGPLRTTGRDGEALFVRPVEALDDATPSATAVAGCALLRLGALRADDGLGESGAELLATLAPLTGRQPLAAAFALAATELVEEGITEVVVAGDRGDLLEAVRRRYEPTAVVLWGERSSSALWEGRADGFAYVCRNRVCAMPAGDVDALVARLEQQRAASAPGVELGFLDGR